VSPIFCECGYKGFDDKTITKAQGVMLELPKWFDNSESKGTLGMKLSEYKKKFSGDTVDEIVDETGYVDDLLYGLTGEQFEWLDLSETGINNIVSQTR